MRTEFDQTKISLSDKNSQILFKDSQISGKDTAIKEKDSKISADKETISNAMESSFEMQTHMVESLVKSGINRDVITTMFQTYNQKMFTNLGEVYDSQTRMDQKQKEEDQNNKKD